MVMSHCRNIALLAGAALLTASLVSAAAAENPHGTAPAVAIDTDGATAPGASPPPARVADETIAPAEDAGVGYAKTRVRHPTQYRKRVAVLYRPTTRVAWVEAIRPIRSILFLGIGF